MKLRNCFLSASVIGLSLLTAAGCHCTKSDEHAHSEAKISEVQARNTALARVPGGKIEQSELEEEHDQLVWSFDLSTPGTHDITEVLVDANTGEVVSVETETAKEEAKEKK